MIALPATVQTDDATATLLREQALGFRVLGNNALGHGILAHLTARLPGRETFWTYQLGMSVEEVRVSDLRECDFDARPLDGISPVNPTMRAHGAIYRARPDVTCVVHHHSDACIALGAIGANIVPFDRNAARWHGEIALVEDFEDVPDIADQGLAYAAGLGAGKALLLKHHGVLVTGKSVRDAVIGALELERTCRVQLLAMAAGTLHHMGPGEIAECRKFLTSDRAVELNWAYQLRHLARCGGDADID